MRNPNTPFAAALRQIGQEDLVRQESHPSAEELGGYRLRRLSRHDRERVAEHFTLCRQCADALLGLPDEPRPAGRFFSFLHSLRFAYSLSVLCLAVLILWLAWDGGGGQLRGNVDHARVDPTDPLRSPMPAESSSFTEVIFRKQADSLTLSLGYVGPNRFDRYRVQIQSFDDNGAKSVLIDGLRRMTAGDLTIQWTRGMFPDGRYRLKLEVWNGERWEDLREYYIELKGH